MTRIVLDAVAKTHFLHHLEIKLGSHTDALGLDEFALALELRNPFLQLTPDSCHGRPKLVMGRHKLLRWKKSEGRERGAGMPGQRVKHADPVDFIAKKFHPHRLVVVLRRMNLDHIPPHPEFSTPEGDVIPLVEHLHDLREEFLAGEPLPGMDCDEHLQKILRRGEAVDARDAGHNDRIPARQQRTHRRESEALDLLVNRGIFFNVGVRTGNVGLRLVVVEVADEILHGIVREELLELAVELRSQRLVVRHDDRWTLQLLNHIRRGEGLAGPRHSKKRLVAVACGKGSSQARNRPRLIPLRTVFRLQFEHHSRPVSPSIRWNATCALQKSAQVGVAFACGVWLTHNQQTMTAHHDMPLPSIDRNPQPRPA